MRCILDRFRTIVIAAMLLLSMVDAASAQENVIYVTLDGFRWQELFSGAEERFITKDAGVRDVGALRERFWRQTPEERREVLMPFLWQTIAKNGQIFGDPSRECIAKLTNGHHNCPANGLVGCSKNLIFHGLR